MAIGDLVYVKYYKTYGIIVGLFDICGFSDHEPCWIVVDLDGKREEYYEDELEPANIWTHV